jgi:hypothetical protein
MESKNYLKLNCIQGNSLSKDNINIFTNHMESTDRRVQIVFEELKQATRGGRSRHISNWSFHFPHDGQIT